MRVIVAAVGKLKTDPEHTLWTHFAKRARAQGKLCGLSGLDLKEIPEARNRTATQRRVEEASKLLKLAPDHSMKIALDETGNKISSQDFAKKIRTWRDNGVPSLIFFLGGPDGHGPEIMNSSDYTLSLSDMTWPHRLARIMLVEQIYRTTTIITNHPYHRD